MSGTSFALCAEDFPKLAADACVIVRADGSFVEGKVAVSWPCHRICGSVYLPDGFVLVCGCVVMQIEHKS